MATVTAGLVNGRHELPVDQYVFEKVGDVLDFEGLEVQAKAWIGKAFGSSYFPLGEGYYALPGEEPQELRLYVTGLTAAVIAVLRAAASVNVGVTLLHFDSESGEYRPQRAAYAQATVCGTCGQ